uniref:Uncharacterized protein n=1 Tax=Magallana gigas TaxID=29159 RepID=K1PW51_MAGGI
MLAKWEDTAVGYYVLNEIAKMTIAQISFFVLILVLGSVTTKQCGPSVKPPYGCRCMKYSKLYVTIRCKNQGDKTPFSTIPHMPNNTDQLIIEGFRFANLTKDIFKNLSSLSSLHRLSLRDNNIINISRDALSELKHLQGLEISYEIQNHWFGLPSEKFDTSFADVKKTRRFGQLFKRIMGREFCIWKHPIFAISGFVGQQHRKNH